MSLENCTSNAHTVVGGEVGCVPLVVVGSAAHVDSAAPTGRCNCEIAESAHCGQSLAKGLAFPFTKCPWSPRKNSTQKQFLRELLPCSATDMEGESLTKTNLTGNCGGTFLSGFGGACTTVTEAGFAGGSRLTCGRSDFF